MTQGPSNSVFLNHKKHGKNNLHTLRVVICLNVLLAELYNELPLFIQYWKTKIYMYMYIYISKQLWYVICTYFPCCVLQDASLVKLSVSVKKHTIYIKEIQVQVQRKKKKSTYNLILILRYLVTKTQTDI